MKTVTLQDIKRHGSKSIPKNAPVYLIVNSKPRNVILPVDAYETMIDLLEELEDIRDIEARKDEEAIPMEEVFDMLDKEWHTK